ncbi:MAG TPA: rhomboid family intramembrane serine protease [Candidatus Paceibacterota bacterium]|nr:rhomboid family intramembrane serine protease [Verrucomicrobiota bacterium]HRY49793.1 rhomboid family intramembrane serine protease [Candidatus Paceibacterota bacterium]HSA02797.1 rhomboid family intramembrane serine protease [Candidatus Paceibacterota bacterium]
MRMIGHLNAEESARIFGDFLYVQGIDNLVESEKDGSWSVWVHAEEELEKARSLLKEFQAQSADPKYAAASREARRRRSHNEQSDRAYRKKVLDGSILWRSTNTPGYGYISLALIIVCGVVFFLSRFGQDMRNVGWLFIGSYQSMGGILDRLGALTEIQHGQIWRLVTPVFLHFGWMHLIFNMMWLLDLGTMLELRTGRLRTATLFLGLAIFSNLCQYLVGGPNFGGMSGVVYGLLGYVWIRGRLDPLSGLFLHPSTVIMMLIWFFLCLFGLVGKIANTAHAAGLLLGILWAYIEVRSRER